MKGAERVPRIVCLLIVLFAWQGDVYALPIIEYEVADLANPPSGDDLWECTYFVSGETFNANVGFTIYFDYVLFSDLEDPPPAISGWDILTFQPEPFLEDDGVYDALALVDAAPLDGPFTVRFFWLGDGVPGSQAFDFYEYDPLSDTVETVGSGQTVPGPGSFLALLALGGLSVGAHGRKKVVSTRKASR